MIRFGFSGCGSFIQQAVLPMMQKVPNAQVVAVFDQNKSCADQVTHQFKIPHRFFRFEDLVDCREIDVIYVASPNAFHKEQTLAAARGGKHVFCQKPMGLNADECRQMVQTCRSKDVKLGIGFCYPFAGAQQKAKELIHQGAIGDVSYFSISFNLGDYNKETVGWRCDPKLSGGGPLMDIAPHLIHMGCFFFDDLVQSLMAYVRPDPTDTDIELDTLTLLEFSRGNRACIDTSFVRGNVHHYSLIGTRGEVRAVNTMCWQAGGTLTLQDSHGERIVSFAPTEGIEQEIRLFCAAIEQNQDPPVPGETGLHIQAVIDKIYESARTRRRCIV